MCCASIKPDPEGIYGTSRPTVEGLVNLKRTAKFLSSLGMLAQDHFSVKANICFDET